MVQRARLGIVIALTTAVVLAFAVLQYRWSNDVREAASVRLGDTLQLSMVNWHMDFFRNFSDICLTLRQDPEASPNDFDVYARRLAEWRGLARYPDLISQVSVVSLTGSGATTVWSANPATQPAAPATVAERLLPALRAFADADAAELERGHPAARPAGDAPYGLGGALRDWRFEPTVPALVRPVRGAPRSTDPTGDRRFLVVELSQAAMQLRLFDDLAHRYFQGTDGLDYEVAVVGGTPRRVLYTSDPGFGDEPVPDADGTADIFLTSHEGAVEAVRVFHRFSPGERAMATRGLSWFPLLSEAPTGEGWTLVVRHRRGGSLAAFVAGTYRRQLAFSFGALFLLAASMAMLIVTSARAHRLGQLQMDFVTAVSHDLRTPLTIIRSAADNLAHGTVDGEAALAEYGALIGRQVRQLSGLVEEVLEFAAMSDGRRTFAIESLAVDEVIDHALSDVAALIASGEFTVEKRVAPNLPRVRGDRTAVLQCLQNLLTNALKYGSGGRWLGIGARVVDGVAGQEVLLSVADKGIGIERSELHRIFEPFYRSSGTAASQVPGTGLGLAVAKGLAEAMKGRVVVESEPGRGSTFTLYLPSAESPEAAAQVAHI